MVISVHSGTFDVENIHIHTRARPFVYSRACAKLHSLAHTGMHAQIFHNTRMRTRNGGAERLKLMFYPSFILSNLLPMVHLIRNLNISKNLSNRIFVINFYNNKREMHSDVIKCINCFAKKTGKYL